MPELSIVYNLLAIGGIGMEIWGFWWLLLYGRRPKKEEYDKWYKKYLNKYPHFVSTEENSTEYYVDVLRQTGLRSKLNELVPIDFINFWKNRKDFAIKLVIIGLFGQIAQIIGSDIIENEPAQIENANQTLGFLLQFFGQSPS